jgi:IstB-like ATP binding protein
LADLYQDRDKIPEFFPALPDSIEPDPCDTHSMPVRFKNCPIDKMAAASSIESDDSSSESSSLSKSANAFVVQACRQFYNVKYIRLPELLDELTVAKFEADGSFRKLIQKYRKVDVLILDEWLLTELPEEHVMLILEIIESRLKRASTIFCSQFSPEGWHAKLGQAQVADVILDRIIHDSYHIMVDGEISMRERHGLVGSS